MPTLTDLPGELLDDIFDLIPSTQDLLSLALINHTLSSHVTYTHLQYRKIRCDIRRSCLWDILASNPVIAAKIRSLEIVDEGSHDWIQLCETHTALPMRLLGHGNGEGDRDGEGEVVLFEGPLEICDETSDVGGKMAGAVRNMVTLRAFSWGSRLYHPPNAVLEALKQCCPELEEVELVLSRAPCGLVHLIESKVWELEGLTRFSLIDNLSFEEIDADQTAYARKIVQLLQHNQLTLRSIQVHLLSPDIVSDTRAAFRPLLGESHFPMLEALSLTSSCYDPISLEEFLNTNPSIRHLSLLAYSYAINYAILSLKLTELPDLESLEGGFNSVIIPDCVVANLRYINLQHEDGTLFEDRLRLATRLEKLVLKWHSTWGSSEYETLTRCVPPTLKRLALVWEDVHLLFNLLYFGTDKLSQLFYNLENRLLDKLSYLTHISGIVFSVYASFLFSPSFNAGKNMLGQVTLIPDLYFIEHISKKRRRLRRWLTAALSTLSIVAPALQYIELANVIVVDDDRGISLSSIVSSKKWAKIERDSNGGFSSWSWVAVKKRGMGVEEWGGLQRDAGGDMWH